MALAPSTDLLQQLAVADFNLASHMPPLMQSRLTQRKLNKYSRVADNTQSEGEGDF